MFKPVHNAAGIITAGIDDATGIIPVDLNSAGALVAALGILGEDHTYLRIGVPPLCEVVRVDVVGLDGDLEVTRAQDGTTGRAFSAGAVVAYTMTAQAVEDIVNATVSPNDIQITGEAPLTVTETEPGVFEVSYPTLNLISDAGTINVTGTYPDISVDIERGAFGCCSDEESV